MSRLMKELAKQTMPIEKKHLSKKDVQKFDPSPLYLYTAKDALNRVTVLKEANKDAYLIPGRFGERRVEKIYCFHYQNGTCRKLFEVESPEKLERFALPYHAAGTPVILPDGSERVISGVIDPDFVESYKQVA